MRIGFVGYVSLQEQTMYNDLINGLAKLSGEPIHFMGLKNLTEDCDQPANELIDHYGDCLKPLVDAPVAETIPFLKYELPELDIVLVEACAQGNPLKAMVELLRHLHIANPNIGFVMVDTNGAAKPLHKKICAFTTPERIVIATTYPEDCKKGNQVVFCGYKNEGTLIDSLVSTSNYTTSERANTSLWETFCQLQNGPLTDFKLNDYEDLCEAAGLTDYVKTNI